MSAVEMELPLEGSKPTDQNKAIGGILVMSGRINEADIEQIQRRAAETGLRFGDAAVELKLITPEDVDFALAQQFNYPTLSHGRVGLVSDDVVAAYDPRCARVEELRTVRSRIMMSWTNAKNRNTLAVVSPGRGDGRSWFTANLATVFAQAGERTLLIDGDMRHPRQQEIFNLNDGPGLSELLTARAGPDTIHRVHDQLPLYVMRAGTIPPNPQELIGRSIFEMALDRFSKQFDLVLIDTPAASESADAEIFAVRSGAAVMLARLDHTEQSTLQTTWNALKRSQVKVLGTIVNEY